MSVQGQKLTFDLAMDSAASDAASKEFATPQTAKEGAMPNFALPGQIASATFFRDLHRFYAAKDKLFPERTSGLIFFENMMGIFFTGRDLTDEVLAETTPEVRFVVAEQQYDPKVGTPQVQLPGFAVVFRMKNPDKFAPIAEEAFQKAAAEDKPIFLSIGYSTCHWCHVMEKESFEDDEVASLLNDTFLNIKVDREERPDIDLVY